jgi:DNA-binding transcriptional MerR regulator
MSAEAPHLSIGEVLAQLRDEFPDITISKIRFLESQGLIDPERTPSGYRKFYDDDLARLRWILFQQKENFLPLKVIKERLDELGPGELGVLETVADPAGASADVTAGTSTEPPAQVPAAAPTAESPPEPEPRAPAAAPAPSARRPEPVRRPAFAPDLPIDADPVETGVVADRGASGLRSRAELAAACGLEPAQVAELESYGLVAPARDDGGEPRFDDDALEVCQVAAAFFARGVQARHLRMYRTFAEREAVLFGQVLLPYVRQRNPEARARLQDELVDLATLGRRLRTVMLRDAARDALAE